MKPIILILIFLTTSLLAKNIATITAMRGEADIKRDGSMIVAALGSKLQQEDNILTKDNTKLQVIFEDETIITIGKNSEFSIQEYLFEDKTEPIAKFSMLKGAMRTITGRIGDIAPQKFSVATKTATIGIRGTNFSLFVEDDGSSSAFCTSGAINVAIGGVNYTVQAGFFLTISPTGEVEIKEFTPEQLKEKKEKKFDPDKTDKKTTAVKKDAKDDGENTAQLDVTTDDNSGLIITDVSDTVGDGIQQTGDLGSIIANYTMQNVAYSGNYTVSNNGGDQSLVTDGTGNAYLHIYFGTNLDNTFLRLEGQEGVAKDFQGTTTINGTTLDIASGSNDRVQGTFQGNVGEIVKGSWQYDTMSEGTASGTFDVTNSNGMQGTTINNIRNNINSEI